MKNILILLSTILLFSSCIKMLDDEELYERYEINVKEKKWENVIIFLDEIIKRNPNIKDAYFNRAFYKTLMKPVDYISITKDLSKYLEFKNKDNVALFIRFQTYFYNKQYDKALDDINKLIYLNGKSAFLLSWKGNCAFSAKKFKIAEKAYQGRLYFYGTKEDLKNCYYYIIFSKYFGDNKEGATWDCAFLEQRGFTKNDELLKLISKNKLVYEELSNFPIQSFTITALKNILNNNCSNLELFEGKYYFRSELMSSYFKLEKTENIKELLVEKEEILNLNLSYLKYKELPNELFKFSNLEYLNLSGNRFKNFEKLFEDLSKFKKLKILILDRTNMRKVPSNISILQNLEVLFIGTNGLKTLTEELPKLRKLKLLSVRGNSMLTDLPEAIGNLKCLERLDISATGLKRIRNEVSYCTELKSISANASKIEILPKDIGNLINLIHLNLGSNKIKKLPKSIGKMENLQDLSLGSNDIKKIPEEISNLENLTSLSVEYNRFTNFPREILNIQNLSSL